MIPEQLQLYQKKKKMDEQLAEVKSEIDSKKKEFKDLLALIKTKSNNFNFHSKHFFNRRNFRYSKNAAERANSQCVGQT